MKLSLALALTLPLFMETSAFPAESGTQAPRDPEPVDSGASQRKRPVPKSGVVKLTVGDILSSRGDGPDGKSNTDDDTWGFWFELAHARGTYRRLTRHTLKMSQKERTKGIPRKVRGPLASLLPNPKRTEGWILHTDWDGRFEGIWADKETRYVLAYPYVEKNSHCAVAITYKVPRSGIYRISGKVADLQVAPQFKQHDGVSVVIHAVEAGKKGDLLKKVGPVGDGHGRPDIAPFLVEKTRLEKGQLIRLAILPNQWWGTDITRIEFEVELLGK